MGTVMSVGYKHLRKLAIRYNAENRAHKFLDKGNLPPAPRHPTKIDEKELLKDKEYLRKEFEELYTKNPQLDEYLKKVYLTSTTQGDVVDSQRPLPQKRVKDLKQMFYEPDIPTQGCCTLTNVFEMMINYREDPQRWTVTALARHYNMDKKDIVGLLTYYSLFKIEDFQFMNQEPDKSSDDKKIEFEVFTALEKKPVRQIQGKK